MLESVVRIPELPRNVASAPQVRGLAESNMVSLSFPSIDRTGKGRRRAGLDLVLRLCQDVARFLHDHGQDRIQAFFSRNRGSVGLYVVSAAESYDFALGDRLAELAAPYIERGLLSSVTLLPSCTPEELTAYFDTTSAIRVEIGHA